jgi:hypothetical protein
LLTVILGLAALVIGAVGVWREEKNRQAMKAMLDLLQTTRAELKESRKAVEDEARQKQLRQQEQVEWKKLKDVGKAIGWVWDRLSEEDN